MKNDPAETLAIQQSFVPGEVDDSKQIELKVILLFFIDRIAMPISHAHIEAFALGEDFMNISLVRKYMLEMTEIGYLEALAGDDGQTLYTITDEGQTALDVCVMSIPEAARKRVIRYVNDHRSSIKNEYAVSAIPFEDYDNGEHRVKCCIQEDDRILMEIQVSVVTKEQAIIICNNWKNHVDSLYGRLLDTLLMKDM